MRKHLFIPLHVLLLLLHAPPIPAAQHEQDKLLITSPPNPVATSCSYPNVLKRQESCQYGRCGESCLSQGAFCCGPAGTLATSPYWVCDNGACITSVRGTTGIVDCYDPDNPSGTTQSCIDHQPTASCNPTDRCYTCDPDVPFCRWETYIAANSPTLRWFSCVATKLADATILAATLTATAPPSTQSLTASPSPGSNNSTESKSPLSTGAIIGIAAGGGIAVIGAIALLAYCCLKTRKANPHELSAAGPAPPAMQQMPMELDSRAHPRSELGSTAAYSAYTSSSQPATPFASSPQAKGPDEREIEYMWRQGANMTPSELQVQNTEYVAQAPEELYGEQYNVRDSWRCGDDRVHMDAAERY